MAPALAFLDLFSGPEMALVLFCVLIFFGGKRMPEFARGFGKVVRELRRAATEVETEFKRAMDEAERSSGLPEVAASLKSVPQTALEPAPPKPAELPPPGTHAEAPPPAPRNRLKDGDGGYNHPIDV